MALHDTADTGIMILLGATQAQTILCPQVSCASTWLMPGFLAADSLALRRFCVVYVHIATFFTAARKHFILTV